MDIEANLRAYLGDRKPTARYRGAELLFVVSCWRKSLAEAEDAVIPQKQLRNYLLPGLPTDRIRECYARAAGNEIDSGKFFSDESSAGLAANAFGYFLERPDDLPPLPQTERMGWPASHIDLETVVRFPWAGGKHPCLDVLIETKSALIGVESKRYEPFRSKATKALSDAYWRNVWGSAMPGYQSVRDGLRDRGNTFHHLDAAQLVKHAFGLRTAVSRSKTRVRKALLFYLFAEPTAWPDGRPIAESEREAHRAEIQQFSDAVSGDEVEFLFCSYGDLLTGWRESGDSQVAAHGLAVLARFFSPRD